MSKINNKQRLEIYHKRKQGETIANLFKQYQLNRANIEYLIRLLDRHGEQILRQGRNRYYSPELKQEIIDKVLIEHQSLKSTSIDPKDKDAIIKQKDEEILRLRAENEYLKKLKAVVQARKDRQQKKK